MTILLITATYEFVSILAALSTSRSDIFTLFPTIVFDFSQQLNVTDNNESDAIGTTSLLD